MTIAHFSILGVRIHRCKSGLSSRCDNFAPRSSLLSQQDAFGAMPDHRLVFVPSRTVVPSVNNAPLQAVMSPITVVTPPIQVVMSRIQAVMPRIKAVTLRIKAVSLRIKAVIFGSPRRLMPVTPPFAGSKSAPSTPSAPWESRLGNPSQCSGKRKSPSETERSSLTVRGFDHGPGGHARVTKRVVEPVMTLCFIPALITAVTA